MSNNLFIMVCFFDVRCAMSNVGCRIGDVRFAINPQNLTPKTFYKDVGCWMSDVGSVRLNVGSWMLKPLTVHYSLFTFHFYNYLIRTKFVLVGNGFFE